MTIRQVLSRARQVLTASDVEEASIESEMLLRHVLKIGRVELYQELNRGLDTGQEEAFWGLIKRRLNHEPATYITGHREFYGLDFSVNTGVLIPRPETELLVEKALEIAQNRAALTIAEVGTGCGAVAICLALHLPRAKIYAIDISEAALGMAQTNCRRHMVADRVRLLYGDMLDPLPEAVDMVVANLPYVREAELPLVSTRDFEPALALNGGPDGLEKFRQLGAGISDKLHPGGSLLLEIGQGQREAVVGFFRGLLPEAEMAVTPDLGGIDRVVCLTMPVI